MIDERTQHTMIAHVAHTRQTARKPALHVRHAAKIVKVSKRSRIWCEIVTCAGTAYETHLVILMIASIVWLIVDIGCIALGAAEEL